MAPLNGMRVCEWTRAVIGIPATAQSTSAMPGLMLWSVRSLLRVADVNEASECGSTCTPFSRMTLPQYPRASSSGRRLGACITFVPCWRRRGYPARWHPARRDFGSPAPVRGRVGTCEADTYALAIALLYDSVDDALNELSTPLPPLSEFLPFANEEADRRLPNEQPRDGQTSLLRRARLRQSIEMVLNGYPLHESARMHGWSVPTLERMMHSCLTHSQSRIDQPLHLC